MVDTLYRGGKGDFLEGGVRLPAMARWPGVIAPGQTVGDITHATDLFTTFARLGGATENISTDRIIDGIDQTALFLKGDTFSRRDYVFIYTGNILAATVKSRYKRHWVAEKPGLTGAPFYDLYTDPREEYGKLVPMLSANGMFDTDPREEYGKLVPMLSANGMFDLMEARHQLWIQKYPNTPEARGFPFTGLENPRPATKAASQPRIDPSKLPFDPREAIKKVPGWAGAEFDQMSDE